MARDNPNVLFINNGDTKSGIVKIVLGCHDNSSALQDAVAEAGYR